MTCQMGSLGHRPLCQSLRLRRFLRFLSTETPSLHRHYPASLVVRAYPSPKRPGLALASCQLILTTAITALLQSPARRPC